MQYSANPNAHMPHRIINCHNTQTKTCIPYQWILGGFKKIVWNDKERWAPLNLDLLVKLVMGWHRKLTVFRVVWRTFSSFRNSSAVSRNGSQSIATLVLSGAGLIFSLRLLIEFQSMGGRRRPSRRLRGLVPCVFNRRRSRYSRPHGDREETKEKKKVTRGGSDLSHYVVQLSIIPSENHIRRL